MLTNADAATYSQERTTLLERRAKFQAEMESIIGKTNFFTHNPTTMQERGAELALFRELHRGDSWHRADDAFQAALMPQGSLVRKKAADKYFFIIRVYNVALLLWPASQPVVNLWVPDPSASSLEWHCVFCLSDWEEIPLTYTSPLHAFTEDALLHTQPSGRGGSGLSDDFYMISGCRAIVSQALLHLSTL